MILREYPANDTSYPYQQQKLPRCVMCDIWYVSYRSSEVAIRHNEMKSSEPSMSRLQSRSGPVTIDRWSSFSTESLRLEYFRLWSAYVPQFRYATERFLYRCAILSAGTIIPHLISTTRRWADVFLHVMQATSNRTRMKRSISRIVPLVLRWRVNWISA